MINDAAVDVLITKNLKTNLLMSAETTGNLYKGAWWLLEQKLCYVGFVADGFNQPASNRPTPPFTTPERPTVIALESVEIVGRMIQARKRMAEPKEHEINWP